MRSPPRWATAHLRRRPFLTKFILGASLKLLIKNQYNTPPIRHPCRSIYAPAVGLTANRNERSFSHEEDHQAAAEGHDLWLLPRAEQRQPYAVIWNCCPGAKRSGAIFRSRAIITRVDLLCQGKSYHVIARPQAVAISWYAVANLYDVPGDSHVASLLGMTCVSLRGSTQSAWAVIDVVGEGCVIALQYHKSALSTEKPAPFKPNRAGLL